MAVISSRRRTWRPPSNGVVRKIWVISSASSAATIRAPIDKHVRVVVLARHAGGVEVVAERGAHPVHLVGRDLLALAAAAEHDARARRRRATTARADRGAVDRVVDGVLGVRAEIVDVVVPLLQHPDEMLFERVAGMVAADCDAHPASVPSGSLGSPGAVARPHSSARGPSQPPTSSGWTTRSCRTSARGICGSPTSCAGGASRARCTAASGTSNQTGDMRFAVSNRIEADARLAQAEAGPPRPEAFVEPHELEPEQQALYRAATRGYLDAFGGDAARVVDLGFRTALPELGVELSSNLGIAAELDDGGRELRKVLVGARRDTQAARPRRRARRARAHRGVGAGAARHRRRRRDRAAPHDATSPTSKPTAPRRTRGSPIGSRACSSWRPTRDRRPGATARAARSSPAARSIRAESRAMRREATALRHRLADPEQLRRLHPLPAALLLQRVARPARERSGAVDRPGPAGARHAAQDPRRRRLLRRASTSPTCSSRTASTRPPVRDMVARHADRCPSRASERAAHEVDVARFHRAAAADVHGDRAHRRGVDPRRDDRRPRLQDRRQVGRRRSPRSRPPTSRRSCWPARARAHGYRLRLRYEYLQPEVDDDPGAVGARRRGARRGRRGAPRRGRAHVGRGGMARRHRRRDLPHVPLPIDLSRQRRAGRARVAGAEHGSFGRRGDEASVRVRLKRRST